jgi:hypothetical protein
MGSATQYYYLLPIIHMSDPAAVKGKDMKSYLAGLENLCEEYLVKKAPAIPEAAKEAIVKFGPWITLILLVLSAPAILGLLGLGAALTPFSFMGGIGMGFNYMLSIAFTIVIMVMEVIALPGLFKRAKSAWYMMFYIVLIQAVQSLISFSLGGLIIGTLLGLYVLFQIKSYYK